MYRHSRHTCLVRKVTGQTAKIVWGHPYITSRGTTLNSRKFDHSSYKPGDFLKVNFTAGTTARVISYVNIVPEEFKTAAGGFEGFVRRFVVANSEILVSQVKAFDRLLADPNTSPEERMKWTVLHQEFSDYITDTLNSAGETEVAIHAPDEPKVEAPVVSAPPARILPPGVSYEDGIGFWLNDDVYVNNEMFDLLEASFKMISTGSPLNVLMVGASGYGKTTVPEAFANIFGMDFLRVNCAQVRDPEEWFGYREARDGSTVFIPSDFTRKVTAGNVVVVLDEFNRVEPWLHNTLYPLLDHARRTQIHGEDIVCGQNVIFFATINLGYAYVGTFQLDAAITNRMDAVLIVDALPTSVEENLLKKRFDIDSSKARKIVDIMGRLRKVGSLNVDVSTRTSLKIARFVSQSTLTLTAIVRAVIANSLEEDQKKAVNDAISHLLE